MRRAILGILVMTAPVALVALGACSTQASLSAQGGECFQATDCQAGLVCIPQKNGQSVCSNDLSGIVSEFDAGGDASAPMMALDGMAPGADGSQPMTDGPAPPVDASKPPVDAPPKVDAPPPPPVDANMPDNAQPPPVDAAGAMDAAGE